MTAQALRSGASALGIALGEREIATLVGYLDLLAKWNRIYNLTAIRDPSRWVVLHLLDSLAVAPHLPEGRVLDVGSGAGLPGIPLAVVNRARGVTLLDSSHKKGAFLRQAVGELGLTNVRVEITRVENYQPKEKFDVVISRAFAELADFARFARRLCAAAGRLIAMKGIYPHEELAQLPAAAIERVERLSVPGLEAERHLVVIDPSRLLE